jgi:polysaccharide biosynthesis protein PslH
VKPRLLYLTPVMPATTGNGLSMRAGTILEALASHYTVTLLVIPRYPPTDAAVPARFEQLCESCIVSRDTAVSRAGFLPVLRAICSGFRRPGGSPWSGSLLDGERFDVVHVFRMAMTPFARRLLSGWRRSPQLHLDLDDIEPLTHRRVAALCHLNGDHAHAAIEELEARRYEGMEADVFAACDRIYVCSEGDRHLLTGKARGDLAVLPNAVRIPDSVQPRKAGLPFSFLFVGTLGYYPNEDAVRYLAAEILPRMRARTATAFRFDIVGAGATSRLEQLAGPELRLIGAVSDVGPSYRDAAAVVAPMRAGGGTRIKILEAFSYQRPVVSTSIGMEGIKAQDEEQILIGDTPDAFAGRCVRLMNDWNLGERLAERAYATVVQAYSFEAVENIIAAFCRSQRHAGGRSAATSPAST